jgi:hypothetical protein
MKDRIVSILLCIFLILNGIDSYFHRSFDSWKYGQMDIGPYHKVIGLIYIIFGLVFLFIFIKKALMEQKEKSKK